jgi:hypothetical protein
MKHIALILVLLLVGCTDDLPLSDVDGEIDADGVATHNPDNCPTGGGGQVEPEPIPERKICVKEMGEEACLDCCLWNHLHVDTPKCAKVPRRKRKQCREEAVEKLARCQVIDCDRHGQPPILTIVPGVAPQ